jgi:cobalt-zinc-cadmium resistance protein CzcA
MLDRIIAFSIKQKLIVGLFILGLIGYGAYNVNQLPIDAVPDITNNQVQVITVSPALGAGGHRAPDHLPHRAGHAQCAGDHRAAQLQPLRALARHHRVRRRTDTYWARHAGHRTPGRRSPSQRPWESLCWARFHSGLGEIFQYVVKPKPGYEGKYDASELRTIQDWIVRRQLIGTEGVADVSSFGGKLKQYEIAVDPEALGAMGITIADVFDRRGPQQRQHRRGLHRKRPNPCSSSAPRASSRHGGHPHHPGENCRTIRRCCCGDVAEVRLGSATRYGAMTYNGEGEAAGAVVMMLKGANSSEVIKHVKERIATIERPCPRAW